MNCPMIPFVTSIGKKAAIVVKAVVEIGSHSCLTDFKAACVESRDSSSLILAKFSEMTTEQQ